MEEEEEEEEEEGGEEEEEGGVKELSGMVAMGRVVKVCG